MPRGVELIIQGQTIKVGNMYIKLLIRKRFSGKLQADHWHNEQAEDIKNAMGVIEGIGKREGKE